MSAQKLNFIQNLGIGVLGSSKLVNTLNTRVHGSKNLTQGLMGAQN